MDTVYYNAVFDVTMFFGNSTHVYADSFLTYFALHII